MPSKPATAARIYDYLLGGMHHYPADQAAAEALVNLHPTLPLIARSHRDFVRRATGYVASHGIRQFLDIGAGLPTPDDVHDIAGSVIDEARVVYVDHDPVVVGERMQILDRHPQASAIWGDLQDPQPILDHPHVYELIDTAEPVALLLTGVLHFLPDNTAHPAVARLVAALPAGSYVILSHACPPSETDLHSELADAARSIYQQQTATPLHLRHRDEVARFLAITTLVEPGLVWMPRWRPQPHDLPEFPDPRVSAVLVGIGRIPDDAPDHAPAGRTSATTAPTHASSQSPGRV